MDASQVSAARAAVVWTSVIVSAAAWRCSRVLAFAALHKTWKTSGWRVSRASHVIRACCTLAATR